MADLFDNKAVVGMNNPSSSLNPGYASDQYSSPSMLAGEISRGSSDRMSGMFDMLSSLTGTINSLGSSISSLASSVSGIGGGAPPDSGFTNSHGSMNYNQYGTLVSPLELDSLTNAGRYVGRMGMVDSYRAARGDIESPFMPRLEYQALHSDDSAQRLTRTGLAIGSTAVEFGVGGLGSRIASKLLGGGLKGALLGGGAAYMGAGWGLNQMIQSAKETMELDNVIRDVTGRAGIHSGPESVGLDSRDRQNFRKKLLKENSNIGLGDLADILKEGSNAGLFNDAANLGDIEKAVSGASKNIRTLMKVLKSPNVRGAIQDMAMFKTWGIGLDKQVDFAFQAEAIGKTLGMTTQGALGLSQQGAHTASAMGYDPSFGAKFGMQAQMIGQSMIRSKVLSAAENAMYGGASGIAQNVQEIVQRSAGSAGSQNLMIAMLNDDGTVNQEAVTKMISGDMSLAELRSLNIKNKQSEPFKRNLMADITQNPEEVMSRFGGEVFMLLQLQAAQRLADATPGMRYEDSLIQMYGSKKAAELMEFVGDKKVIAGIAQSRADAANSKKVAEATMYAEERNPGTFTTITGAIGSAFDWAAKPFVAIGKGVADFASDWSDKNKKQYLDRLGIKITKTPESVEIADAGTIKTTARNMIDELNKINTKGINKGILSDATMGYIEELEDLIATSDDTAKIQAFTKKTTIAVQKDLDVEQREILEGDTKDVRYVQGLVGIGRARGMVNTHATEILDKHVVSQDMKDKVLASIRDNESAIIRKANKVEFRGGIASMVSRIEAGFNYKPENQQAALNIGSLFAEEGEEHNIIQSGMLVKRQHDRVFGVTDFMRRMESDRYKGNSLTETLDLLGAEPEVLASVSKMTGISMDDLRSGKGDEMLSEKFKDMTPVEIVDILKSNNGGAILSSDDTRAEKRTSERALAAVFNKAGIQGGAFGMVGDGFTKYKIPAFEGLAGKLLGLDDALTIEQGREELTKGRDTLVTFKDTLSAYKDKSDIDAISAIIKTNDVDAEGNATEGSAMERIVNMIGATSSHLDPGKNEHFHGNLQIYRKKLKDDWNNGEDLTSEMSIEIIKNKIGKDKFIELMGTEQGRQDIAAAVHMVSGKEGMNKFIADTSQAVNDVDAAEKNSFIISAASQTIKDQYDLFGEDVKNKLFKDGADKDLKNMQIAALAKSVGGDEAIALLDGNEEAQKFYKSLAGVSKKSAGEFANTTAIVADFMKGAQFNKFLDDSLNFADGAHDSIFNEIEEGFRGGKADTLVNTALTLKDDDLESFEKKFMLGVSNETKYSQVKKHFGKVFDIIKEAPRDSEGKISKAGIKKVHEAVGALRDEAIDYFASNISIEGKNVSSEISDGSSGNDAITAAWKKRAAEELDNKMLTAYKDKGYRSNNPYDKLIGSQSGLALDTQNNTTALKELTDAIRNPPKGPVARTWNRIWSGGGDEADGN